jgi:hypothetical protein
MPPPAVCRSRWREAEDSLIPEVRGKVASSPDNAETGGYCQTARARQARSEGVRKEPVS